MKHKVPPQILGAITFAVFAVALFFVGANGIARAAADSFNYVYTDGNGVSATGTLTGTLIAPGEYNLIGGTITLNGAPACTNCGSLSGPMNGTGTLVSPPPQPFQVGGGTELIGLDDLLFPNSDPQLDTNGGLSFQMRSGLGVGIGGNGPGNYWIFGGNWSLNDNNGVFVATAINAVPTTVGLSVTSTLAGASSFAVTVYGSNFIGSSTVQWNGSPRVTTFISSSSLTTVITAGDFLAAGTSSITVTNPVPGGGISNAQIFTVISATPDSYTTGFENFTLGDVDGQYGWTSGFIGQGGSTHALFDVKIVPNTYGYASFQNKSLRISNATTSSAFGDQTFSASLINEAGETDAATSTYSGGVRQPYFEAQWDFASAVPGAEQPGLSVVASADPGNGSRMTWLQMQDTPAGLQLNFDDYESSVADFVLTPIAMNIDRTVPHTVKMTIQFIDGPSNDIVQIYLDGVLIHTGTTWEDYSRSVGSEPSAVDSIMFRVAGTPAPATAGKGFLIDNFSEFSGPVPVPSSVATKFIFANVTSSVVVGNNTMFNVLAVNSLGTIDASFEQGVTLIMNGSGAGGGLVTIVNGVGTTTVSDHVAQTVTLGLQDSQSTGLDVGATAHVTFTPGPVAQFVLNHPGDMNERARLGYTVSQEDQFGNFVSATGSVAHLYTNSPSANAAFFNASAGGTQITSVTIPSGSTSTVFWYYDDVSGSRTVTASDNSIAPDGATGIADASDTFSVAPGAVKFIFANVPASETAGTGATVSVEAVDSFNVVDPSYNGGVTVTTSGSATGSGLVTLTNGVGTATVSDLAAETVTIGFLDTQGTGLGVTATAQVIFNAAPVTTPTPGPASTQVTFGIKPGVTITFAGMAYPGATVTVISKAQGLLAAPVTQAVPVSVDGSFLVELENVTRLTGQTYLLSFVDRNGLIAQTKAYNIPMQDKLVYGNILAAPTLGFLNSSVVSKGKPLAITGYATPKATVELFIDGNPAGTVLVNDPSGKYTYSLNTDTLNSGRHAVWAIQKNAQTAAEVSGYTNSLSRDEIFIDDATNGVLIAKNSSTGSYAFVPAITGGTGGGVLPVVVGQMYAKQAESDFSNQESFTVSPLANPKLDLNGDGVVDIKDLSIFLSYLKNLNADVTNFHITDPNIVKTLDFNGDGVVDGKDLNILATAILNS